jgi:ATP-binding cassette subfamily B protein
MVSSASQKPSYTHSPAAEGSSLSIRTILRLGHRYLVPARAIAIAYIVTFLLCQTIIPLYIARNVRGLTNYFSANFSEKRETAEQSQNTVRQKLDQMTGKQAPYHPADNLSKGKIAEEPEPSPQLTRGKLIPTYALWAALVLLLIGAGFGQKYITSLLAGRVSNDIRRNLFSRLLEQPSEFFHRHNFNELTLIVNQFCLQVQMALQTLLIDPVLNIIGIVVLGHELYSNLTKGAQETGGGAQVWLFFAAIVMVAMLSPWLMMRLGGRLQTRSREMQNQMLSIQSLVAGALNAPEEIQAMRAESIFDRKHGAALDRILQSKINQTLMVETVNVANRLPGDLVLISLLGLAVYVALAGTTGITGGIVILLFTLTPQFMGAVQGLSGIGINASMNWPAVEAVDAILQTQGVGDSDVGTSSALDQLQPTLEGRELVFSYPGTSKRVLDDVSFVVPARQISGLIAKAGQGKTTFFRLVLRFYEPQQGTILLGGRPHVSLPLAVLRQQVVLMHQSPAFFYDTIRENFLVAKPTASDEEIKTLCQKTPLWNILEDSYGSEPLDQPFRAGDSLSGGQKKLFALTRCLLRNPAVLLLDEPTTGIDPEEKFELVTMMKDACAGRTVLVVDHDIVGWQVLFCDYFFVLNNGKIEQQGPPGELLSEPGLFKDLFDKQAEGFHKMSNLIKQIEAQRRAEVSLATG